MCQPITAYDFNNKLQYVDDWSKTFFMLETCLCVCRKEIEILEIYVITENVKYSILVLSRSMDVLIVIKGNAILYQPSQCKGNRLE